MATTNLPFPVTEEADISVEHMFQCGLFKMLPEPFQEASRANVHLLEYLHRVPVDEVGVPEYYPELSRSMQGLKHRNLIYPIKDGVFAHIYPDPRDRRDFYIPVEPSTTLRSDGIVEEVEKRLVRFASEIGEADSDDEKEQRFLNSIDKVCTVSQNNGGEGKAKQLLNGSGSGNGDGAGGGLKHLFGKFKGNGSGNDAGGGLKHLFGKKSSDRVQLTSQEIEKIKYLIVREKIGMGAIEPLLQDTYIEDISCSGLGTLFVEHKIFKSLKSAVTFNTDEELDKFVLRLAERVNKPLTLRSPIVDATLPDGSRINIVYGSDISKRGSNFTIRRSGDSPLSILELIEFGSLDYQMAAYLSLILEEGMNLFVSGETASGKTTLLNAITTFIPPHAKIVSVEDTPELQVPHTNWIQEVAKMPKKGEEAAEVTMFDLLKSALRQRPNEIIIGEIRGEEGSVAFQAMQTGHAVMATFHASSVEKLIQRLTGNPISIPKAYVDNLNAVVIQSAVKLPGGKTGRRAISISEIVGYDPEDSSFSFVEIFRWNASEDKFEFPGKMNSYLLERKIAIKRGIPANDRRQIYTQLDRRAKILEKLHKERGIKNFYELLQVLAQAQKEDIW